MSDLDALPFAPTEPETARSTVTSRPCRHRRDWRTPLPGGGWQCRCCSVLVTPEAVRRGRNYRKSGLQRQRDVLRRMGLTSIPGSNLIDGDNDAFTAEVKTGGRFNGADYQEIAKQRAVAGARMPLLVKLETPGGGRRARGTVTVDLDDWVSWYGPAGEVTP